MPFTGTLPDWIVEPVRAGDLDSMTDALDALVDAWTSYVPVLTSSSGVPTVGNGTLTGSYRQVGKAVDVRILLTRGGTTSFGTGIIRFSLPVTAVAVSQAGSAFFLDSGSNWYSGGCYIESTTTMGIVSASGGVTSTVPITWATSDQIGVHMTYEAA